MTSFYVNFHTQATYKLCAFWHKMCPIRIVIIEGNNINDAYKNYIQFYFDCIKLSFCVLLEFVQSWS